MNKNENLDLSYFMGEVAVENVEYPAPKRFVDKNGNRINLVFRILSIEEQREIRKHHRKRTIVKDEKTGRPYINPNGTVCMDETFDSDNNMAELLVESLVYPDLSDKELMKHFNCFDVLKMPAKVFPTNDELLYVYDAFNRIHGFTDNEEGEKESDVEKAKN